MRCCNGHQGLSLGCNRAGKRPSSSFYTPPLSTTSLPIKIELPRLSVGAHRRGGGFLFFWFSLVFSGFLRVFFGFSFVFSGFSFVFFGFSYSFKLKKTKENYKKTKENHKKTIRKQKKTIRKLKKTVRNARVQLSSPL